MLSRRSLLIAAGSVLSLLAPRRSAIARRFCRWRWRPRLVAPSACDQPPQYKQVQPNYDAWDQITVGMAEAEVEAILGAPLEKQERLDLPRFSYMWTYGELRFDTPSMPSAFYFLISFQQGQVFDKSDPFDGGLSCDGRPSTPRLTLPRDDAVCYHYPRFVDLRWQPSSAEYPLEYMVEVGVENSAFGANLYVPTLHYSEIPYLAIAFSGKNKGRWRVKARNHIGESDWTPYRHFTFTV